MSLTHTAVEIAPRPDGRRRWKVGAKTYTEIPIHEDDDGGPASVADVDAAMLTGQFRRTLAAQQADALDALLLRIPAAQYARDRDIDGSVARRRYTRVRRLFGEWLREAGLMPD